MEQVARPKNEGRREHENGNLGVGSKRNSPSEQRGAKFFRMEQGARENFLYLYEACIASEYINISNGGGPPHISS